MSLAALGLFLSAPQMYRSYQILDTVSGILLRLSGLGVLSRAGSLVGLAGAGPSAPAVRAAAMSGAVLDPAYCGGDDLLALYQLRLPERLTFVASMLLDFNEHCSCAGPRPQLLQPRVHKLMDELIDHTRQVAHLCDDASGTANAPAAAREQEMRLQPLRPLVAAASSSSSSPSSSSLAPSAPPDENNAAPAEALHDGERRRRCYCQSRAFQESLQQLLEVTEEAYAHVVAIQKRAEAHRASWYRYLPGLGQVDHSANVSALRTGVVPRLHELTNQCLDACQWARSIVRFQ